jgi:hypothetical protein
MVQGEPRPDAESQLIVQDALHERIVRVLVFAPQNRAEASLRASRRIFFLEE